MSPQAGTRRRSPQLLIGYFSLLVLVVGAGLTFKWERAGQIMVVVGALALVVALVLELRTRKHHAASEESTFAEGGTFGGRRSPQTHTQM